MSGNTQREMLGSRLGFLLLSAGCAIGLGNVWRFPYITGAYGGAIFVGIYLLCLFAVVPTMIMEFAVGRAARRNMGLAFHILEPKGSKWHWGGKVALIGSYLLMMFYTTVTGWMLYYCWYMASGALSGLDAAGVGKFFGATLGDPVAQVVGMTLVVLMGCGVCAMGVQKGVERVVKLMMLGLLFILMALVIRSLTLPNIFNVMAGGQLWGTLFFIFMSFAALSTVIAVFENIISYSADVWGMERRRATWLHAVGIWVCSLPCALGFNLLADFQPLGAGTCVLDLEDFLISNNILPLGGLFFLLFCCLRRGWGWDNFIAEVDQGVGMKFPRWLRGYVTYVLPCLIIFVFVMGYVDKFWK